MKHCIPSDRSRSGFSLVELVVVVLIMGILAAVAAPRMFDKMAETRAAATRQSLVVLRKAIDLYKVEEGVYPSSVSDDLVNFVIEGEFPAPAVLPDGNSDVVDTPGVTPLEVSGDPASWVYNSDTGEIRVNHAKYIAW